MKKMVKYMGITAATLLAVAPIAMPAMSSATETTVKADAVSGVNQADVQKWLGEVKSNVTIKPGNNLLTSVDKEYGYVMGGDGVFCFGTDELTPQSPAFDRYADASKNLTNDLFASFNDNANGDDLFFNDRNVGVLTTATDNDGSISGNLKFEDINKVLQSGASVTFHVKLAYVAGEPKGSDFYGADATPTILGSKDVVVTVGTGSESNDDQNNQKSPTGVNYDGFYSTIVDAKLYDGNGKATSTTLPKQTLWKIDRKLTVDGTTYYRVASNEWIKENDGIEIFPEVDTITTRRQAKLYTSAGKEITDRSLAPNTSWYTDRVGIVNNENMRRVATDEWVSFNDLKSKSSSGIAVGTN
ncbi:hypothetical protein CPR19088_GLDEOEPO_00335 [Companilactobacillus paralimentarius]